MKSCWYNSLIMLLATLLSVHDAAPGPASLYPPSSSQCMTLLLAMPHWSAVQLKMITKVGEECMTGCHTKVGG